MCAHTLLHRLAAGHERDVLTTKLCRHSVRYSPAREKSRDSETRLCFVPLTYISKLLGFPPCFKDGLRWTAFAKVHVRRRPNRRLLPDRRPTLNAALHNATAPRQGEFRFRNVRYHSENVYVLGEFSAESRATAFKTAVEIPRTPPMSGILYGRGV